MAKKSYTMQNVSIAYAPMGTAPFDCKEGIAEGGVQIQMAEDFGERTMGADGSTLWSEYMTNSGTITLNVLPNSPACAFFLTLQATERTAGQKGQDTMTINSADFNEAISCSDCAIQSIGDLTYDKTGATVRTIVISAGDIQRIAA